MGRAAELAQRRRLRSRYPGEYVAWIGNEIAAHGKDLKEVVGKAEKRGERFVIEKVRKGGVQVV